MEGASAKTSKKGQISVKSKIDPYAKRRNITFPLIKSIFLFEKHLMKIRNYSVEFSFTRMFQHLFQPLVLCISKLWHIHILWAHAMQTNLLQQQILISGYFSSYAHSQFSTFSNILIFFQNLRSVLR